MPACFAVGALDQGKYKMSGHVVVSQRRAKTGTGTYQHREESSKSTSNWIPLRASNIAVSHRGCTADRGYRSKGLRSRRLTACLLITMSYNG
eukprot:1158262-Pelagomonas_calceolata.AAC.14